MNDLVFVDGLSVKPHCTIGFTMCINQRNRSLMPKLNKSVGMLSQKAKSKMTNAINWMVYLSANKKYYSKKTKQVHKLQLNFITLTLCSRQMHSDEFIINRMLRVFLKWLTRQGNELYVWRAEAQANGNIHFHITSNKYVHWESIRNKWNDIQRKHGYIRLYQINGGDENPNSTDVRGVKDVQFMAVYMCKYMGKSQNENSCKLYCSIEERPYVPMIISEIVEQKDGTMCSKKRVLTCKVWNCSNVLMNKRITITEMDFGYEAIRSEIESRCESQQLEAVRLFTYPSNKFRNGLMHYVDEQLSINESDLLRV